MDVVARRAGHSFRDLKAAAPRKLRGLVAMYIGVGIELRPLQLDGTAQRLSGRKRQGGSGRLPNASVTLRATRLLSWAKGERRDRMRIDVGPARGPGAGPEANDTKNAVRQTLIPTIHALLNARLSLLFFASCSTRSIVTIGRE